MSDGFKEFNEIVYDKKTGSPVVNDEDGTPATWGDIIAEAGRQAREQGMRLLIEDTPDGQIGYRLVKDSS